MKEANERAAMDMPEEPISITLALDLAWPTKSKVPAKTLFQLWLEDHLVKGGRYDDDTGA